MTGGALYPAGLQASLIFQPTPEGWRVTIELFDRSAAAADPETFELPELIRIDGLPALAGATADQMRDRVSALDALARHAQNKDETQRVGKWLFDLVLAGRLDALRSRTTGLLDIAITAEADDAGLTDLPWELMHTGDDFVAGLARVAITRRVRGASAAVDRLTSPPRVLFVVGTSLTEMRIRPGAEYLGLLRMLRRLKQVDENTAAQLYLRSHLLLEATPERLKAALEQFAPSVVHFICHGEHVNDEINLELQADDRQQPPRPAWLNVDGLIDILRVSGMPQVVILNACDTATATGDTLKTGQELAPFAARLVSDRQGLPGVPVVVAMAGEIADDACRLFAHAFYAELMDGGDFVQASAAGRRAGIFQLGEQDRYTTIDWAFPVLYLSEAMRKPLTIDPPSATDILRYEVAHSQLEPGPPPLCGRMAFLEQYEDLMGNDRRRNQAAGAPVGNTDSGQVLALKAVTSSIGRVGMTWLLQDLAAVALRDGHVPCLLVSKQVTLDMRTRWQHDWPLNFNELLELLMVAANNTAEWLGLKTWSWVNHDNLLHQLLPLAPILNDPLVQRTRSPKSSRPEDEAPGFAGAVCRDLIALLDAAVAQRNAERASGTPDTGATMKLLVLVDDVHKMNAAAQGLFDHLLGAGAGGFGAADMKDRVRLIFTYADSGGDAQAHRSISDAPANNKRIRETPTPLTAYEAERRQAYVQYLLGWRRKGDPPRPLMFQRRVSLEDQQRMWTWFDEKVRGYPGNFEKIDEVIDFLASEYGPKTLRRADDTQLLQNTV